MKVLFVCNQGKDRSRTASELWKEKFPNDEVKYIGVFVEENPKQWFSWADKIYVMEDYQHQKILEIDESMKTFGKIAPILEIEDIYQYGDQKLKRILKQKLKLIK
jgi:predicted protein tyrosine phosphatase